ncbi:MAG: serine protease [Nocardioidaceae bacterium]|nr:serine protease [Nocardioidaceae bacterium]
MSTQTPTPPPDAPHAAPRPSRRRRAARVATGTAVLVLIGAGSFTLGTASAHEPTAGAVTTVPAVPSPSQGSTTDRRRGLYGGTDDGSGYQSLQETPTGQTTTDTSTATAAQLVGLVRIESVLDYGEGEAAGTGMILTSNGEVVTNHHVVEGSTKLTVTVMSTGKEYAATVVGTDATDDVAVIQLTGASGLTPVQTDTDGVDVGDAVTAVGDANGTEDTFTASSGPVVAEDQQITTQSEQSTASEKLSGLVQFDADVISGDSGGATYDAQGEVVGMTTAASSGGNVQGYAIPVATVLRIADDLDSQVSGAHYTYGTAAFLGIGIGQDGTVVQGVYDGSAAAGAGIVAGDEITWVGSTPVTTADALLKALSSYSSGDRVTIKWTDSTGASHAKTVTLGVGPVA